MNIQSAQEAQGVLRWLVIVRWAALADLLLLIVLLVASVADNEIIVRVFGLTHGLVFLALLAMVATGSLKKLWSWWFLISHPCYDWPSGSFYRGIPDRAKSQGQPRYFWGSFGLTNLANQMRMMVVAWIVLDLTDSQLWVGLVNGLPGFAIAETCDELIVP